MKDITPDPEKSKALEILNDGKGDSQRFHAPTVFTPDENAPRVEKAKTNIEDALKVGAEAVMELSEIARSSEHPRAYEVLANMLKTVIDGNKMVIDMEKSKNKAGDDSSISDAGAKEVTHQHIHVGSSSELLKMLEEKNKLKGK